MRTQSPKQPLFNSPASSALPFPLMRLPANFCKHGASQEEWGQSQDSLGFSWAWATEVPGITNTFRVFPLHFHPSHLFLWRKHHILTHVYTEKCLNQVIQHADDSTCLVYYELFKSKFLNRQILGWTEVNHDELSIPWTFSSCLNEVFPLRPSIPQRPFPASVSPRSHHSLCFCESACCVSSTC